MGAQGLRGVGEAQGLRGTPLDVFGYSAERKTERRLIDEYKASLDEVLRSGLLAEGERLALAVQIARIPEEIRGYGHVKARHLEAARTNWETLMVRWRGGGSDSAAGATAATAKRHTA